MTDRVGRTDPAPVGDERPIRVAVLGHTNTGKTSLLRTLTRDAGFGEVSSRPAVTRHVEGTVLELDDRPLMALYDTPGMEDSIGLLEWLDTEPARRGAATRARLETFLASDVARTRFSQEAKGLAQLLSADIALYVIDARDRVLGKHRDELEILARAGRPIVAVLNFTAAEDTRADAWREALSLMGLHAIASFDTVVFDLGDEARLFEKMRTLLDDHRATLDALIEGRRRQHELLLESAARVIADLLVDVAAAVRVVPRDDLDAVGGEAEGFRSAVRARERRTIEALLELYRFRTEDLEADPIPRIEARLGLDLFSPDALRQFGIAGGGAAAAGAMAGLTLDVMLGGLSLGVGTASGAAIGALAGFGRAHARRLIERVRGYTELRADDATLRLLLARQTWLVRLLARRGHAARDLLRLDGAAAAAAGTDLASPAATSGPGSPADRRLRRGTDPIRPLLRARQRPNCSSLTEGVRAASASPARDALVERVAEACVIERLRA